MLKYYTSAERLAINTSQVHFKQCIKVGNYSIIIALLVMACCISISFFLEQYFSLFSQVVAHISTIIFAGIAKVGYVIRCVGAHGLGHGAY